MSHEGTEGEGGEERVRLLTDFELWTALRTDRKSVV